jgi:hypothetical protein
VHQMDVKSSFLNGYLQEDVYMLQPPDSEISGQENKSCKLVKALYGLKQEPRAWYAKMDAYLQKVGFLQSELDDTLYVLVQGRNLIILVMYVNDFLITSNNNDHIFQVKKELMTGFEMKDFGFLHYYIGVEVMQQEITIFISQTKCVSEILKKFGMEDCKLAITPME